MPAPYGPLFSPENSFVVDGDLLILVLFGSEDPYITLSTAALSPVPFSPLALPCIRHLNLQAGLALAF